MGSGQNKMNHGKIVRGVAWPAVALVITAGVARGDMPLPPPSRMTFTSPHHNIRVVSDPKMGTRVENAKLNRLIWSLPDWYRSVFVADDGKHIVTEYEGLNLIPLDFTDDMVLLTFWREGQKIR